MPLLGAGQRAFDGVIQLFPQTPVVALDFLARRPVRGGIRG